MKRLIPQQIKHYACLPFRNLTTSQRVLQYLRLGTSLLTVIFVVVLLLFNNDPMSAYVARINCSHIDVAYGLYNSLGSSISDSTMNLELNVGYLPLAASLTDSEISILSEYTQNQVMNAPQGILLGVSSWCTVDYKNTDSFQHQDNLTTTCFDYGSISMFDYRALLSDNGLTIILAYAYKSDYKDDDAYERTVANRAKQFYVLEMIVLVQVFLQSFVFISTLVVYANRGSAKALTSVPPLFLNIVAVTSMAAGISMIAAFAVVFQEINATMKEISHGISSFGINMKSGKTFFTVAWLALAFSCLSMISWILPLWCSNPPEEDDYSDDEMYSSHHDISSLSDRDQFVVRPYQVTRQTKKKRMRKTHSRLFDDDPEHDYTSHDYTDHDYTEHDYTDHDYADHDHLEQDVLKDVFLEGENDKDGDGSQSRPIELSSREHSESELRKLGEKMARKLSTRQVSRRKQILEILPEREETRNLLYSDRTFANHLYPQELPKSGDVTRAGSLSSQVRKLSDPVLRTRNLVAADHHTRKQSNSLNPFRESMSDGVSLLDEQEMEYLDNTNVINKIK